MQMAVIWPYRGRLSTLETLCKERESGGEASRQHLCNALVPCQTLECKAAERVEFHLCGLPADIRMT